MASLQSLRTAREKLESQIAKVEQALGKIYDAALHFGLSTEDVSEYLRSRDLDGAVLRNNGTGQDTPAMVASETKSAAAPKKSQARKAAPKPKPKSSASAKPIKKKSPGKASPRAAKALPASKQEDDTPVLQVPQMLDLS